MGLQVYYSDDVRNVLLAAEQASGSALRAGKIEDDFAKGYGEGYRAALTTIALAFGLLRQQEPAHQPLSIVRAG